VRIACSARGHGTDASRRAPAPRDTELGAISRPPTAGEAARLLPGHTGRSIFPRRSGTGPRGSRRRRGVPWWKAPRAATRRGRRPEGRGGRGAALVYGAILDRGESVLTASSRARHQLFACRVRCVHRGGPPRAQARRSRRGTALALQAILSADSGWGRWGRASDRKHARGSHPGNDRVGFDSAADQGPSSSHPRGPRGFRRRRAARRALIVGRGYVTPRDVLDDILGAEAVGRRKGRSDDPTSGVAARLRHGPRHAVNAAGEVMRRGFGRWSSGRSRVGSDCSSPVEPRAKPRRSLPPSRARHTRSPSRRHARARVLAGVGSKRHRRHHRAGPRIGRARRSAGRGPVLHKPTQAGLQLRTSGPSPRHWETLPSSCTNVPGRTASNIAAATALTWRARRTTSSR